MHFSLPRFRTPVGWLIAAEWMLVEDAPHSPDLAAMHEVMRVVHAFLHDHLAKTRADPEDRRTDATSPRWD